MNRERDLLGSNGYDIEIGFNPLEFLCARAVGSDSAKWLDLCCGTGRALDQAAAEIASCRSPITITGVDLVGMFSAQSIPGRLWLIEASLSQWSADEDYDLITCVHGLHYVGDKLDLIARAASWLCPKGIFVASLDASNIVVDGFSKRVVINALRDAGFEYSTRKKLLKIDGPRDAVFPFRYLGGDDRAGSNYTGQAAVNFHYERI